ncbi:BTB/POZ-like protein [Macrophomina phaseolina MS6]|uniref:BTB/POZ-like protein n=1 Tax=Macrophomina phaseolina (strain MS6) TaxID=1126212 RepID=K2SDB5_MACPH|nr:BTB/POZ-like protein [Macrophomina phaseolina MS6]
MSESNRAETLKLGKPFHFSPDQGHIDRSDVDSASEGIPVQELAAPRKTAARRPQSLLSDVSTSPPGDATRRPTNTSDQKHVSRRHRRAQSTVPFHHSGTHPAQATTTSQISPPDGQLTLNVGGKTFLTARDTLMKSAYFRDLLGDQSKNGRRLDASPFIDANACLFEDILQYMRRGILPVYWDRQKGHDHPRYAALLVEARYFRLDALVSWLKEKRYLQVVKQHIDARIYPDHAGLDIGAGADVGVLHAHCFQRSMKKLEARRVYACPRGIDVHVQPGDCGKRCKSVRGQAPPQYVEKPATLPTGEPRYVETVVYDMLIISNTITFDNSICLTEN